MNFGKSTYKSYLSVRKKPSTTFEAGFQWARSSYIPNLVDKGLDAKSEYGVIEYQQNRCVSGVSGEYYLERAGLSLDEHKAWCAEQVNLLEDL